MYLKKVDLTMQVEKDMQLENLEVQAVVHQETIWPDVWECRVHMKSGICYSAIFHGDCKLSPFVEMKATGGKI